MNDSTNSEDPDSTVQRVDEAHPERTPAATPSSRPPSRQTVDCELPKMAGPPIGMRRAAADGSELIDAMAGRASLFGFGFQPHLDAILAASEQYLGDAVSADPIETSNEKEPSEDTLFALLASMLGDSSGLDLVSAFVVTSPDLAVEKAIELARTNEPTSRYRTISLVGSDHGRTGVCRTASGRPELHEGYGPMMAGFCHVSAEDIDSLRQNIDDQTAAVLLSPVDLHDAARPLSGKYLTAVRQLCDEHDLLLIVDESRLCFGSAATPFIFSSIADIRVDAVMIAGGLFAGLPGAILLTNGRMTPAPVMETSRYPLLTDVAVETMAAAHRKDVLKAVDEAMTDLAVRLAECIGHFEFVRDVHATGMTLGIETDVQAGELVRAAARHGLRIEAAGDTSIRLQPPLVISEKDQEDLLKRIGATMDFVHRDFADLVVS